MSEYWYDGHWRKKETADFISWFIQEYGLPVDYDSCQSEQDEYWLRRGFALMGWLAALKKGV